MILNSIAYQWRHLAVENWYRPDGWHGCTARPFRRGRAPEIAVDRRALPSRFSRHYQAALGKGSRAAASFVYHYARFVGFTLAFVIDLALRKLPAGAA